MASPQRLPADLVAATRELAASAPRLEFFQLVAYLERLTGGAARVGGSGPVFEERLRFRHEPSLTFHAGDVTGLELRDVPAREEEGLSPKRPLLELTTTFFGLTGAAGPLPQYLAEEVLHEEPEQPVRRELLDLFHHRLLGLLYRLVSRYHLSREFLTDCTDPWSRRVLALSGIDTYDRPASAALPAWRLLRISSILAGRARTADQLEAALEDVLGGDLEGARVAVKQFVGRWMEIDARLVLGRRNNLLGRDALLGGRAFDRTTGFGIEISPLPLRAYKRLLPEGELLPIVHEVVARFLRDPLEYSIDLVLAEDLTRTFRLSGAEPSLLGRDTWLGTSRMMRFTVPGAP